MKSICLGCILTLCVTSICRAQSRQDRRTAAFINAFTRYATRDGGTGADHEHCIHSTDVAQEHLFLWRQWLKTHRWPPAAERFNNGTPAVESDATSVVRISWWEFDELTTEIEVDNSGRVGAFQTRFDCPPGETEAFYLKPQQMNLMQRLLVRLPPSRKVLEFSDVVLVSGRRNGRWAIRMYSRRHAPEIVKRLLQVVPIKTSQNPLQP